MLAWLNKILNVRPGEWSRLLLLSAILLLINLGSGWGTTVVYAAFLEKLGPLAGLERLIWVILLSSFLSIPAMAIYGNFVDQVDNNKMFIYIVIVEGTAIFITLLFLAISIPVGFAFPFLYILSLASTALFNPHFSTYVNELYDIQSAKRAMPLILAAGRIGSILAGFSLQPLTERLSNDDLIKIWLLIDIVVIGIIFTIPYITGTRRKEAGDHGKNKAGAHDAKAAASPIQNFQEILHYTFESKFLRWMAIGTLFMTALMALFEYNFNKIMIPLFSAPGGYAGFTYAGFIGWLNGVSNIIAMLILLLGIGRVTKSWGVANASLIFPSVSLLVSSALIGSQTIIPASLAYLNRKGFRFSLLSPVESLLYNAIPIRIKGRARAFISGQIAPLGGILGVVLLVILRAYGASWTFLLEIMIAMLAVAYIACAFLIRSEYTRALVKMLEEEDYSFLLAEGASELTLADPATLQRLKTKLDESTNREMRIFMTQLIAQVGGAESLTVLIPAIKTAADASTRAAMLNVLAASGLQGDKIRELFVSLLSDVDGQVRQAAAGGLEQILGPKDHWLQGKLLEMINDSDTQVSLYALQSIVNTGEFYKFDVAVEKLNNLLESDLIEHKKSAIDILGKIAQPQAVEQILIFMGEQTDQLRLQAVLELEKMSLPMGNPLDKKILEKVRPLSQDSVARIRQAVILVLGKFNDKADHALLVAAMADKNPQVRSIAVNTLVKIGKDVMPLIQAELKAPDLQTQNVATVALSHINHRQFSNLVEAKIDDNLRMIYHNISIGHVLGNYENYRSVRVLLAALRETNHEQVNEILYLLSANHSPEILKLVRESLDSELTSTRSLALEALESMTSPRVASLIASLFEPSMKSAELQQLGQNHLNILVPSPTEAFQKLLSTTGERILILLTLQALGDIVSEYPPKTKPAKSKTLQLLDAIAAPVDRPVESSSPGFVLSPELQSMVEKMANDPDEIVKETAQTVLQKNSATQESRHVVSHPITEDGDNVISLVERVIIFKETSFFRNIPITQLESLALVSQQKKYEKDCRIFKKGDPGGALYILVNGQVGIEQEKRVGSALLATIENNSYFGEMSLFDNSPRSASAVTLKDSTVLELSRGPIISLTMQNPDLALELIKVLSQRIRETSDRMAEAARSRPRELHKLYDQFD